MPSLVTALSVGLLAAVLVSGSAFVAMPAAAAMSAADKAARKDATAKCRAQVKEQAHFEEMSLLARHRAVKKCVKDILAGH